jgi:hypothetical protein
MTDLPTHFLIFGATGLRPAKFPRHSEVIFYAICPPPSLKVATYKIQIGSFWAIYPDGIRHRRVIHRYRFREQPPPRLVAQHPAKPARRGRPATGNIPSRVKVLTGAVITVIVGAVLRALLRKNEPREQTSVRQAALKVLQAHREVVALYYWPPSGISKSGRGEIDLLNYGKAACFESRAHRRGAHKETRRLVVRPWQRKHWGSGSPLLDLVTREAPARF